MEKKCACGLYKGINLPLNFLHCTKLYKYHWAKGALLCNRHCRLRIDMIQHSLKSIFYKKCNDTKKKLHDSAPWNSGQNRANIYVPLLFYVLSYKRWTLEHTFTSRVCFLKQWDMLNYSWSISNSKINL